METNGLIIIFIQIQRYARTVGNINIYLYRARYNDIIHTSYVRYFYVADDAFGEFFHENVWMAIIIDVVVPRPHECRTTR